MLKIGEFNISSMLYTVIIKLFNKNNVVEEKDIS